MSIWHPCFVLFYGTVVSVTLCGSLSWGATHRKSGRMTLNSWMCVQSPEMVAAVGKLSYNQLVEKIIDYKHSADSSRVSEGNTFTHWSGPRETCLYTILNLYVTCLNVCVVTRSGSRAVLRVHSNSAVVSWPLWAQHYSQRGRDLRVLQEQPFQYYDQTQGGAIYTAVPWPNTRYGC